MVSGGRAHAFVPPQAPDRWGGLLIQRAYCGGSWQDASDRIDVTNPADGRGIGSVPRLTQLDVVEAVRVAKAQLPAWRDRPPRSRADVLMAWRELMLSHRDALAALMTFEQGKPLADARGEIEYGAEFVRWFAEEASRAYGDVIPSHLPRRKLFVQREPLGVVGMVTPWNFPSAMLTRKAAAALAAGCAVVATPANETPFSAIGHFRPALRNGEFLM